MLKDKVYQFLQTNDAFGKPIFTTQELVYKNLKTSKISRRKITQALLELQSDGKIVMDSGIVKNTITSITGKFVAGRNGNGRVVVKENNRFKEYFVPASLTLKASNNSTVNFVVENEGQGNENARITKIVTNGSNIVYGAVKRINNKLVLIADDARFNKPIELLDNQFLRLAENKRCSIELLQFDATKLNEKPIGVIKSEKNIFGFINNPMANISSVLDENGISQSFPEQVLQAASETKDAVTKQELSGRLDLRHLNFVTIDPATCKDMDDAVAVEKLGNGKYRLYVAIADVSHYVKAGSEIDNEAFKRGTSVYPAGSVQPMLPEALSNGICSLNPNVDRLTMVGIMDINDKGEITNYDIKPAVINSKHKFAYEEVSAIHANEKEALEKFGEYKEHVDLMYEVAGKLTKRARRNGTLKIQGFEPTIVLNENKDKVIDYRNDNHVDSHEVIERFMVAFNEISALTLNKLGVTNVLRTHDQPDEKKFEDLVAKLATLGVDVEPYCNNAGFQKLLNVIDTMENNKALYDLVVRSMKRAEYGIDAETGHFALALNNYTHFTSPIRRYVDLIEHRLMKGVLEIIDETVAKHRIDIKGKTLNEYLMEMKHLAGDRFKNLSNDDELYNKCYHLNERERTADKVSKQTDEICAALYMQDHIGEVFGGYIKEINKDTVIATIYNPEDPAHSNIIDVTIPLSELNGNMVLNKNGSLSNKGSKHAALQISSNIKFKIESADPNLRIISATCQLDKKQEQTEEQPELVLQKAY